MSNFFIWEPINENLDNIIFSSTSDYLLRDYSGAQVHNTIGQTSKSPFQIGESFLMGDVEPRSVNLQVRIIADSKAEMNELKRELSKSMVGLPEPFDVASLGKLTYVRSGQDNLEIQAVPINSPMFSQVTRKGNVLDVDIEFLCPDPIWNVVPDVEDEGTLITDSTKAGHILVERNFIPLIQNNSFLSGSLLVGLQYLTDFGEYNLNKTPSDWTKRIEAADPYNLGDFWVTEGEGEITGNILASENDDWALTMLAWDLANNEDDIEIVARYKTTFRDSFLFYLLARMTGTQRGVDYSNRDVNGYFLALHANEGEEIRCGYYLEENDPDYTEFPNGAISFSWEVGEFLWFRLRVVGDEYKAKWWKDGQVEPENWGFEITTQHIESGKWHGIGNFSEAGLRFADLVSMGIRGEVAPVIDTLLTVINNQSLIIGDLTVEIAGLLSTDFTEYPTGVNPSDWTEGFALNMEWSVEEDVGSEIVIVEENNTNFSEYTSNQTPNDWTIRWETANQDWEVVDIENAEGFKSLKHESTENNRRFISWDEVDNVENVDLVCKVRSSNNTGTQLGMACRADANINGYILQLRDGNEILIFKYFDDGGSFTILDTEEFLWNEDEWYYLRFRVIGNRLRGKVWPEGESEPEEWMVEAVDEDFTSGMVGFFNLDEMGIRDYDLIEVVETETTHVLSGRVNDVLEGDNHYSLNRWNEIPNTTQDIRVKTICTLEKNVAQDSPLLYARVSGSLNNESFYRMRLRFDNNTVSLAGYNDGSFFNLESIDFNLELGVYYNVVLECVEDNIRGKVWEVGEDEPEDWQLEAISTSNIEGYVGVGFYKINSGENESQFDYFEALTLD